jgi:hypothetical protein
MTANETGMTDEGMTQQFHMFLKKRNFDDANEIIMVLLGKNQIDVAVSLMEMMEKKKKKEAEKEAKRLEKFREDMLGLTYLRECRGW